jgi:hypothetical protein
VARVLPTGPRALSGELEFAEARDEIWGVLSVGSTDPRLLSLEVDVDTGDLAGIRQSKQRPSDKQLRDARASVAAIRPGAPVQEVV